jgi:hypothetical protein
VCVCVYSSSAHNHVGQIIRSVNDIAFFVIMVEWRSSHPWYRRCGVDGQ